MNGTLKSARRSRRPAWAVLHALLLCAFVWNQYYIPVHLAGHEHTEERLHHVDAFGAEHEDEHSEEHDSDGHEPHPASDHLSGYIGTWQAPQSLLIQFVPLSAATPTAEPELAGIRVAAPPVRGPPAFSSSAA